MKKGDVIGIFRYAKVKEVDAANRIVVEDLDDGQELEIVGQSLIDSVINASTANKEEKVSRTDLEGVLMNVGQQPFTVKFTKQNGDERTITGVRLGDANFGRSLVKEFGGKDLKKQVDHRTLQWIVVDGVKYITK